MLISTFSAFSQTQNTRLFVSPFAVQTNSGAAPTATNVGTTTGANNAFSYNAAFDASGALMFYVNSEHEIVDRWGNVLVLDDLDNGNRDILGEIAIIKVPTYTDRYYIVFGAGNGPGTKLIYTTVEFECDNQLSIVQNSQLLFYIDGTSLTNHGCVGIAVSQESGGQRKMYVRVFDHINEYNVTAAGIQHHNVAYSNSNCSGCYEMELSPDGTKLATICDDQGTGDKVEIITLSTSGTSSATSNAYALPGGASKLKGIEFAPNGTDLFMSWSAGGSPSSSGVHILDLNNGTFSNAGPLMAQFGAVNLELGRDGRMYAVSNNSGNNVWTYDLSTSTVTTYPLNSLLPQGKDPNLPGRFILPDQIDGDPYNYTLDINTIVSSFHVNDNDVMNEPIQIQCNEEIMLNGSASACAETYFIGVRDLVTNQEHMEWLSPAEVSQLMAGTFDLRDFCANPQLGSLAPTWNPSPSMPLIIGRCYEVKLALSNSANPWVASVQTICITGSVNPNFKLISDLEGCISTEGFIELLAFEPGISDHPSVRYWSGCELDQNGEPIISTCIAYATNQLGNVNNPYFSVNDMGFEEGKCYRITQHIYDEVCQVWATSFIDICICCEGVSTDPTFNFISNLQPCASTFGEIEIQANEPGIPDDPTLRYWSSCELDGNGNILPNTCVSYSVGSLGNVNEPVFSLEEAQFRPGKCYAIIQHIYDENCGWVSHTETICICGEWFGKQGEEDLTSTELQVFPNPAQDVLTLEWHSNAEHAVEYIIYDLQARPVQSEKVVASKGQQRHSVNTSTLAAGQYILQLRDGDVVQTRRITIQR